MKAIRLLIFDAMFGCHVAPLEAHGELHAVETHAVVDVVVITLPMEAGR